MKSKIKSKIIIESTKMFYDDEREVRMDKIIKLEKEGLVGLYFFEKELNFPIAVGTYSKWQETQVSYLVTSMKNNRYDTEYICRWCISHEIPYQILYPIDKMAILKKPYKYYKFLCLKRKLKKLQET